MTLPSHKTPREIRLAQDLANASVLHIDEVEALIELLQRDDTLMAELMGVCARAGPSPNNSGFEFFAVEKSGRGIWMYATGKAGNTHYPPEPSGPEGSFNPLI